MNEFMMKNSFVDVLRRYDDAYDHYTDINDNTVRVTFSGENMNEINVMVSFSQLDSGAMLVVLNNFDLFNYEDKFAAGVLACNHSCDNGMVTYYIDDEKDAVAEMTLMFNAFNIPSSFCPEQVLSSVIMLAMDVDDNYPVFARAKWSD